MSGKQGSAFKPPAAPSAAGRLPPVPSPAAIEAMHRRDAEAERAEAEAAKAEMERRWAARPAEARRRADEARAEIEARGKDMPPDPPGLRWFVVWTHKQDEEGQAAVLAAQRRFAALGWLAEVAHHKGRPFALLVAACTVQNNQDDPYRLLDEFAFGAGYSGGPLCAADAWTSDCGPLLAAMAKPGAGWVSVTPMTDPEFHEDRMHGEGASTGSEDDMEYLAHFDARKLLRFPLPQRIREAAAAGGVAAIADALQLPYSIADVMAFADGMDPDMAAEAFGTSRGLSADQVPPPMVVEGVLPAGVLGVLVGGEQKGKTQMMLDLAHAIASGASSVWGCSITPEHRGRRVVFLYAEDSPAEIGRRLGRMSAARTGGGGNMLALYVRAGGYEEMLRKVRLLAGVAAIFLDGIAPMMNAAGITGENDVDKMGPFLNALSDLARETGAAVLIAHHIGQTSRRNPNPDTPAEVWEAMRGSTVIRQRVRYGLTLHREGKHQQGAAVLGVAKSNMQDVMPLGSFRLTMDRESCTFSPLGSFMPLAGAPATDAAGGSAADDPDDAAAAAAAVRRLVDAGREVWPTGDKDLYAAAAASPDLAAEVKDWTRGRCRRAVQAALASALLVKDRRRGLLPA